jgi:hypothetical protein
MAFMIRESMAFADTENRCFGKAKRDVSRFKYVGFGSEKTMKGDWSWGEVT